MSNLKPFSFDRWQAGDEVMYRDGKEVLELYCFLHPMAQEWCIHALAWDGSYTSHLKDGTFEKFHPSPRDIVMKPKKVKYWFASWENEEEPRKRHTSNMFTDRSLADQWKKGTHMKDTLIHEIEIEE